MHVIGGEVPVAVTVDEFKRATHFSGGDNDDDLSLAAYLSAAQEVVETATGRVVGARAVRFETQPQEGARRWWFPVAPLGAVLKIETLEGAIWQEMELSDAQLLFAHDEPQLLFASDLPQGALAIEATVGDNNGRDKALKQAMTLIAKSWFEAGIAIEEIKEPRLSFGARALIRQVRYRRPCIWGAS